MIDFQKALKDKIFIKTAGIQFKNLQGKSMFIIFTKTRYFEEKPAKKMCAVTYWKITIMFGENDNKHCSFREMFFLLFFVFGFLHAV